jgi:hypothetical protein
MRKPVRSGEDAPLLSGADPDEHAGPEGMFGAIDEERRRAVQCDVDLLLSDVVLVRRVADGFGLPRSLSE